METIRAWLPVGSMGSVDGNVLVLRKPPEFQGALPDATNFPPGHMIAWLPPSSGPISYPSKETLIMVCVEVPIQP